MFVVQNIEAIIINLFLGISEWKTIPKYYAVQLWEFLFRKH